MSAAQDEGLPANPRRRGYGWTFSCAPIYTFLADPAKYEMIGMHGTNFFEAVREGPSMNSTSSTKTSVALYEMDTTLFYDMPCLCTLFYAHDDTSPVGLRIDPAAVCIACISWLMKLPGHIINTLVDSTHGCTH
jgi:hypothetical protein